MCRSAPPSVSGWHTAVKAEGMAESHVLTRTAGPSPPLGALCPVAGEGSLAIDIANSVDKSSNCSLLKEELGEEPEKNLRKKKNSRGWGHGRTGVTIRFAFLVLLTLAILPSFPPRRAVGQRRHPRSSATESRDQILES